MRLQLFRLNVVPTTTNLVPTTLANTLTTLTTPALITAAPGCPRPVTIIFGDGDPEDVTFHLVSPPQRWWEWVWLHTGISGWMLVIYHELRVLGLWLYRRHKRKWQEQQQPQQPQQKQQQQQLLQLIKEQQQQP